MDNQSDVSRLNKFIAFHVGISRREADQLISAGRVRINSTQASIGSRVHSSDTVTLDGKELKTKHFFTTILFHKPVGYVCSRRSQGDWPTIYSLLPPRLSSLKTVGRLDRDSSGLILLTDNGDFAHSMTHPSFHKIKVYEVTIDKSLQPLHRQMICDFGVMLEDGKSKFELERISSQASNRQWRIIMHEGRNRQIRRTFAALGYEVTHLHRTQFGNYSLGDIKSGNFSSIDIPSMT